MKGKEKARRQKADSPYIGNFIHRYFETRTCRRMKEIETDIKVIKPIRLLVTGGRAYWDEEELYRVLDKVAEDRTISVLIHGDAAGADTLAGSWAKDRGIPTIAIPADWQRLGRRAGPIRNRVMLEQCSPDLVIAFPGGRGTRDMIRISKAAGIEVIEI
ncbi:MAG: DUF2493 domain-containing protein [Candidatus Paceibacterota bacterium]|jgi:hypothetical protein